MTYVWIVWGSGECPFMGVWATRALAEQQRLLLAEQSNGDLDWWSITKERVRTRVLKGAHVTR